MPLTIQRSFYDASRDHGLWSPSTSSANFCEEDWQVYYIAEFVNTISNLAYIYFALRPTSNILHQSNQQAATNGILSDTSKRSNRTIVWDFHTVSLILVGVTSGLFHATLRAWPQWLDETSMYLLAGSFVWSVLTTRYVADGTKGSGRKSSSQQQQKIGRHDRRVIGLGLAFVLSLTSLSTMWTGNADIHSIMFAIMLAVSGLKLIYLLFTFQPRVPFNGNTTLIGFPVSIAQRKMLLSLVKAILLCNLAFGLWLVDCNPTCCGYLRHLRNDILGTSWFLRPFGMLTELHAWWHVLTAAAAGEYIGLLRLLTTEGGT